MAHKYSNKSVYFRSAVKVIWFSYQSNTTSSLAGLGLRAAILKWNHLMSRFPLERSNYTVNL